MNEYKDETKQPNSKEDETIDLSDYENYVFSANLCTRLSQELQLQPIIYDDMGAYTPPAIHGLSNADIIIPSYYQLHKHPSKILELDYYAIIKDDICNFRVLTTSQLDYIKELSHESKNELIELMNQNTKIFHSLL